MASAEPEQARLGVGVLLVEDDPDVREATALLLDHHGFDVIVAADGIEALELIRSSGSRRLDVAVVDVAMPRMDGLTLTERLVAGANLPVILLTARDLPGDVVRGLDLGAADYVTKPFDGGVLAARIRAVCRQASPESIDAPLVGDHRLDRSAMSLVSPSGERVALTPTEFRILDVFARHRGQVLSRSQVLGAVWNDPDWTSGRTVDVNIQRIRSKVGADAIETIRGVGYRLR